MEGNLLGSETAGKILTKDSACPSLTYKQRLYGFLTCFILGIVFSLLSFGGLIAAFMSPAKFGLMYSLGNLSSIGSTCFFFGPQSQMKRMFKNSRIIATILFLSALIGTLVFVWFFDKSVWWHRLCLLHLIFLQFCTLFWYTLSYIPFGRTLFKKICFACCCSDDDEGSSGGEAKS